MLAKHVSMMSESELHYLDELRKNCFIKRVSRHCKLRMKQRNIITSEGWNFKDFDETLHFGTIIECRKCNICGVNHYRILVRSTYSKRNKQLCFSIDLNDGCLCTSYLNSKDYNHSNLDYSQYTNFQIC